MRPTILDQLQPFFADFAAAWEQGDPQRLDRFIAMPLEHVVGERRWTTGLHEEALKLFRERRAGFEAQGVASARIMTVAGEPAGLDGARATTRWELFDDDDEPLLGYDVVYLLDQRGPQGWRITEIDETDLMRAMAEAGWSERRSA